MLSCLGRKSNIFQVRNVIFKSFSLTSYVSNSDNGTDGPSNSLPGWVPQWKGRRQAGAEEFKSPVRMLNKEIESWRNSSMEVDGLVTVPRETDILIMGGGLVGQALAYFLKREHRRAIRVTIVERDPSLKQSSSSLSVGGIRQQFSIPENVQLSMLGADILRRADEFMRVDGLDPVHVPFHLGGYMFLSETDEGSEILERNIKMQKSLGAVVDLLSQHQVKSRYPWMNVDRLKAASLGLENEGNFDPWCLLGALKMRNLAWGVRYVNAEVIGFEFAKSAAISDSDDSVQVNRVIVKDLSPNSSSPGPQAMKFWKGVIACGAWSGEVAKKMGIGTPEGPPACHQPLPVEPRKRYVYVYKCPNGPGLNMPGLTIEPSGLYFRREGYGGYYLCGRSPCEEEPEPDVSDLSVDESYFTDILWPLLANRAPCFENLKLTSSWAGYYDYNYFDENLVVGPHPHFKNILFACGLSGHGIQQALGVGRAVSELIYYDRYRSIDLSRFHFDRIVAGERLLEDNIV